MKRRRSRKPTTGASTGIVASMAILVVVAAAAANEIGQGTATTEAPFAGLSAVNGVFTSNDEYSIWLHRYAETFRIRYPDGRRPFEQSSDPIRVRPATISIECRADGRAKGLPGPEPANARLELPMHPEAPAVYRVTHPMYWVLGLAGREVERIQVQVSLPAGRRVDAELVRQRTDYSFERPALRVALPPRAMLELFAAGAPIEVSLSGNRVNARLRFAAKSDLGEPARRAMADCPAAPQQ